MDDEKLDEIIGDVYCEGFNRGQEAMIYTFVDIGLISKELAVILQSVLGMTVYDNHYDRGHEKKVTRNAIDALRAGE